MSSSRKKVLYWTVGGLSFAGALGAWVYYKRNDYDDDDIKPEKVATKVKKSDLRLKQVQVIFRHGARTPIHLIPNVEEVCFSCICNIVYYVVWFGLWFFFCKIILRQVSRKLCSAAVSIKKWWTWEKLKPVLFGIFVIFHWH